MSNHPPFKQQPILHQIMSPNIYRPVPSRNLALQRFRFFDRPAVSSVSLFFSFTVHYRLAIVHHVNPDQINHALLVDDGKPVFSRSESMFLDEGQWASGGGELF